MPLSLALRLTFTRVALAALVLAAVPLTAQSQPTPTTPPPNASEVVELSPFEVKGVAEDKWSASSTLLGNRTSQELVKCP